MKSRHVCPLEEPSSAKRPRGHRAIARASRCTGGAAGLLMVFAFASAALGAPPLSTTSNTPVVVLERVARPGLYVVRVTVSTKSSTQNHVSVTIGYYGAFQRHAVTATKGHHAKVSVRIRIATGFFTISAVGQRSRPTLAISIHRLAPLSKTPPPPPVQKPTSLPPPPTTGSITPPPPPKYTDTSIIPPPPIQTWVPANSISFTPLSDPAAAQSVIAAPETRPSNVPANQYVPTTAQLQSFYGAVDHWGRSILTVNPYYRYVTGNYVGTTDEIIQWAAWKWGLPEDWLRAQDVQESWWYQSGLGDLQTVSATAYPLYPAQSRVPGTYDVYQTMGIGQIKWSSDGTFGAGTEPLRWESTAFCVDYQAATIRFYYDNPQGLRGSWGDPTYQAGQAWNSVGGWFEAYPWLNPGQASYINSVQGRLSSRTWEQPGF